MISWDNKKNNWLNNFLLYICKYFFFLYFFQVLNNYGKTYPSIIQFIYSVVFFKLMSGSALKNTQFNQCSVKKNFNKLIFIVQNLDYKPPFLLSIYLFFTYILTTEGRNYLVYIKNSFSGKVSPTTKSPTGNIWT